MPQLQDSILTALGVKQQPVNGTTQQILSQRQITPSSGEFASALFSSMKPTFGDASRAAQTNAQAMLMPEAYKPMQMHDLARQRASDTVGFYDAASKVAESGNQEAIQTLNMVKSIAGDDPQSMGEILQGLHELPYNVNPSNATAAITEVIRNKGIQLKPKTSQVGGATGALVQQYMESTGADFPTALYAVQTGMRQGTQWQNGAISPIPGIPQSKRTIKYNEAAGSNEAERDFAAPIAANKVMGQTQAESLASLPAMELRAETALSNIDALLNSKGFNAIFGLTSMMPNRPGSQAADAQAKLDQIRGEAFLQAYQSLKGGGQITEVEGVKAENAIARLNVAQSAKEARVALDELKTIIQSGLDNMRNKAAGSYQNSSYNGDINISGSDQFQANEIPQINPQDIINELRRRGVVQ